MPGAEIPATILIVDDDALINIGTADMIEDMGLRALEAYSGREALDILERGDAIDLLITDYSMPGMTGVELAARARQLRPSLPVLLATGYDELPGGEVSDLPRLGKPFQQAELLACLQRALATGGDRVGNGDPVEIAGASRAASGSGLL
ncbi:response regulator [Devosia ginsengisoli]|uniref:response regulator n=1 Tax=Devosia ginsengisoli TaxID=400770 RepID=UPI0026ECA330|nr:response regulator [Devosia ginsengisoli]MCR6670599.1 response regulator [Devosia ginsengisoli]